MWRSIRPWLAVVVISGAGAAQGQPSLSVRFHHLHLEVEDPAVAMNTLARQVEGSRVILPGLGVGVRSGGQFVLFDRGDAGPAASDVAARFDRIAAWLRGHGIAVEPQAWRDTAFGSRVLSGDIDHVAFVVDDLPRMIEGLRAKGITAERRSDEAIALRSPGGDAIEIVADTDRPDVFWCPMHLDVRSPTAGKCAICGMDLVPIPPLRLGEYRLDVEVRGSRRVTGLQLRMRDSDGRPVTAFATVHERPFHLFIVSRDLQYFAHVHPEPAAGGAFELKHGLPPGEYVLLADFLPYGGTAQMVHRALVTPGVTRAVLQEPPPLAVSPTTAVTDGVRVRLQAELAPRKEGKIHFTLTDAETDAPITDLEPYLGAAAHMLIVKPDLTDAIHEHPQQLEPASTITFEPLIPAPGLYKLWVQFQRKGKVSTTSFVVNVQ